MRYSIQHNGAEVASRSEKPAALRFAENFALEDGETVAVVTPTGKVVFTRTEDADAGREPGKRRPRRWITRPYTRTDRSVEAQYELPEGYDVAYSKVRSGVHVLRVTGGKEYALFSTKTGALLEGISTTREAQAVIGAGFPELPEGFEL
jgi:hypothetical protein